MLMNKECYKGDADDEIIKCQVDDSVQIVKKMYRQHRMYSSRLIFPNWARVLVTRVGNGIFGQNSEKHHLFSPILGMFRNDLTLIL